jgi:hypothetical protein
MRRTNFSVLCLANGTVDISNIKFGLSVFLNYQCIPSTSLDNRDYTVIPTMLFESPKGPSDKKRLWPTNPLIRPPGSSLSWCNAVPLRCRRVSLCTALVPTRRPTSVRRHIWIISGRLSCRKKYDLVQRFVIVDFLWLLNEHWEIKGRLNSMKFAVTRFGIFPSNLLSEEVSIKI